jgi:hypothetical protein
LPISQTRRGKRLFSPLVAFGLRDQNRVVQTRNQSL